jgi:hypothetical protein
MLRGPGGGRRTWFALLFALLVGAVAVPLLARRLARDGVAVELVEVVGLEAASGRGLLGRAGAALKAAGSAALGGSVRLRLKARNTTPVPVWVRSARFRTRAMGREVGQGAWKPASGPQLFWPGQDVTIVATLDGDGAAMRAAGVRFVQGKDVEAAAEGEVEAGLPPIFLSLPFRVERVGMPQDRR